MSYKIPLLSKEEAIEQVSPFYGLMQRIDSEGHVAETTREVATRVSVRHTSNDREADSKDVPFEGNYAKYRAEIDAARQQASDFIAGLGSIDSSEIFDSQALVF